MTSGYLKLSEKGYRGLVPTYYFVRVIFIEDPHLKSMLLYIVAKQ